MNQLERERLVERYLSGDLSPNEEQEFFIQVAVDNYLRQTLKAYRIIENAMRKDRDGIPPGHSDLRARVMGIWAMRNLGPAPVPTRATQIPNVAQGFNAGRLFSTVGMARWAVSAAGAAAIAVGVFLAGTSSSPQSRVTPPVSTRQAQRPEAAQQPVQSKSPESASSQSVTTPSESEQALPSDRSLQPTAVRPSEAVSGHGGSKSFSVPAEQTPREKREGGSASRAERTDLRRAPAVSSSAEHAEKPSEGASLPDDGWREEVHHPTVSTSDTIKFHLKVTLPKP